MSEWCVAQFELDKASDLIPSSWIISDAQQKRSAYWPPYKNSNKILRAIEKEEVPGKDWPLYVVAKIFARASNYEDAKLKLEISRDQSDVEEEFQRRKNKSTRAERHRNTFETLDTSTEDDLNENDHQRAIDTTMNYPKPPSEIKNNTERDTTELPIRTVVKRVSGNFNDDSKWPEAENLSTHSTSTCAQLLPSTSDLTIKSTSVECDMTIHQEADEAFRNDNNQPEAKQISSKQSTFAGGPVPFTSDHVNRSNSAERDLFINQINWSFSDDDQQQEVENLSSKQFSSNDSGSKVNYSFTEAKKGNKENYSDQERDVADLKKRPLISLSDVITKTPYTKKPRIKSSEIVNYNLSGIRGSELPRPRDTRRPPLIEKENVDVNAKIMCITEMCKEILYNQAEERARNEALHRSSGTILSSSFTYEFSVIKERFPITNLQEFKKFNTDMRDKEYALQVKSYLESIGGSTKHTQVRGMLFATMRDEVAVQYSFCGQRNKQVFKDLRIWDLILDIAVKPNDRHYTCHDADKTCMLWLKQAQKRLNDAKKKKSRSQNNGITEDGENSTLPQNHQD